MFVDFEAKGTPLKYKKYEKYYIGANGKGQWLFKFPNNYGASVVKHWGSYGYEEDKFELAVLYFTGEKEYDIAYNTPITNNVLPNLSNKDVLNILKKIKNLKED